MVSNEGNTGVLYPGLAQRMSAGTGILHSEKNDSWRTQGGPSHEEPVRFIHAVRLTGTGGQKLTAASEAEVLIWEMHATVS